MTKQSLEHLANNPALTLIYRAGMVVAIATIMWFASEFLKHKDEHVDNDKALAVSLTKLNLTLQNMQTKVADRYTGTQAEIDFSRVNKRLEKIENRVHGLEMGGK